MIRKFAEDPAIEVLNGRYGPYVAVRKEGMRKASNYKIPKGTDPASLTYEDVKGLIRAQDEAPAKKTRRTAKKK